MTTSPYQSTIDGVLEKPSATLVVLELTLHSETDGSYTYNPLAVEDLTIRQDTANSYTDVITCSFKASPRDYAVIYEHKTGLLATLRTTFLDPAGTKYVYTPAPRVRQYRALIRNPVDNRRQNPDVDQRTTPDQLVTIELIDKRLYDLRHTQFNSLFSKSSLADILRYIVKSFDTTSGNGAISALVMAPPDNTHVYPNFDIPPGKDFSEIFDYLQDRYGVYMKGMQFYYTDGTLYLYPPYENEPKYRTDRVTMYRADQGGYSGSPSFHRKVSDDVTEIVVTGASVSKDLSRWGAETHGTSVMLSRASQMGDGWVTTDARGSRFTEDTSYTLRTGGSAGIAPKMANARYAETTDNVYIHATQLAKYQTVLTQAAWAMAVPFTLSPGQPVSYCHSAENAAASTPGIIETLEYHYRQSHRTPFGAMAHTCSGNIGVRLKPDAA